MIPNSAAALDRFRKGLPEGHWLSNDTFGYLGRSLLDLSVALIGRSGIS